MNHGPAASLTGVLLAAKGAASPQGFDPRLPEPVLASLGKAAAATGALKPKKMKKNGAAAEGAKAPRSAGDERIRLSFRLDPDRHRRLKLLSVHLGKSSQRILDEALDRVLSEAAETIGGGGCACLNGTGPLLPLAPRNGSGPYKAGRLPAQG